MKRRRNQFLIKTSTLIFIYFTLFNYAFFAWANPMDEIEEAKGLPDETPVKIEGDHSLQNQDQSSPLFMESNTDSKKNGLESTDWKLRSYFLLESLQRQLEPKPSQSEFPNFEAGFSASHELNSKNSFFIDGIVNYYDWIGTSKIKLNQMGVRTQISEKFHLGLGKERNRRSPGFFMNPSDLLLTPSTLPGLRENRNGTWLIRNSYQEAKKTVDLFLLPMDKLTQEELPTKDSHYLGTVLRTFNQWDLWDFSFSLGKIKEVPQAGMALQGILARYWKPYYEAKSQKNFESDQLLGLSYEGDDTYGFKLEYYYNGQGLNKNDFDLYLKNIQFAQAKGLMPSNTLGSGQTSSLLLLRKHYAFLNISAMELKNKFNAYATLIQSLEESSHFLVLRGEYLKGDRLVFGTTFYSIHGGLQSQFLLKQFDRQWSIDMKYSL